MAPMGWLTHALDWIEQTFGVSPDLAARAIGVALVIVAYIVVRRVVRRVSARAFEDASTRYQVSKATGYLFGAIAIATILRIVMPGLTGMATYLGLLSAGIAVALQDPLANLAAWLFIVVRRPFEVGDRVQIGPHAGDVVDIRIFQFVMLEIGNWVGADQSTGRIVYIPNNHVFKHPQVNYDKAFQYLWNEIAVVVTFESNWRRAKEVLTRIVNDHAEHLTADAKRRIAKAAERMHIRFTKLTPVVWTAVVDDGVRLTLRYLCKVRNRRASTHEMWEAILDEFAQLPDVDFAYRTVRHFDGTTEGKQRPDPDRDRLGPDEELP